MHIYETFEAIMLVFLTLCWVKAKNTRASVIFYSSFPVLQQKYSRLCRAGLLDLTSPDYLSHSPLLSAEINAGTRGGFSPKRTKAPALEIGVR